MKNILKNKLTTDLHLKELIIGASTTFIFRIIGLVIGYIFTIFVSRNYGADSMGILSLVLMVITISSVVGKIGVDTALVRFVAEYNSQQKWYAAKALYKKAIAIVLPLAATLSLLIYFVSPYLAEDIFKKPHLTEFFYFASLGIVPIVWLGINLEVLRGLKNIKLYAFYNNVAISLASLSLLIISFYILSTNIGVPVYTYVIANILILIFSLIALYRIFKSKLSLTSCSEQSVISLKRLLSVSFPMFLTGSMGLLMGSADTFMLGIYRTETEIGVYAVALKVAMITSIVLVAVNTIAGPKFAELWGNNDVQGLKHVAQQSTRLIFYVSFPALLIFLSFPTFILSIFGNEFKVGTTALMTLALGQFINVVSGPIGQFMNMTENQKVLQYTAMIAALLNILLNYLLIPKYGITGAAIATAIAGGFWNLSCVCYVKIKHNILILFVPFMR